MMLEHYLHILDTEMPHLIGQVIGKKKEGFHKDVSKARSWDRWTFDYKLLVLNHIILLNESSIISYN